MQIYNNTKLGTGHVDQGRQMLSRSDEVTPGAGVRSGMIGLTTGSHYMKFDFHSVTLKFSIPTL